ncbi:hypothetical protein U9M48_017892 [Paspalum notatum var. saurae]|uniref:Disease resistance N-terminal domain-containing protein n=1 Tax=Paspalum notatum var. saurae TaxID=547442 RepID=A0AAQ3TBW4_PASNO
MEISHTILVQLLSELWAMESLLSAIMSDLLSRALSTVIQRYRRSRAEEAEQNLQRLQRVLLRIDAAVEEAEGRHITNQAMLQQLETLRQGMYEGHFMLDTCRYRGHEHGDGNEGIGGHDAVLSRFSSAWRLLSFPIISSTENMQNTVLDAENLKMLEKMVDRLVTLMGDMAEFAVFLDGYPRIGRGPYSEYLVIDKVMFGRQMEKETVINFLLRSEADGGDGKPGVLPIVGAMRVGKSTLVEHVCLDERVRGYFSSIFFAGDDLGAENMVIKHQNLSASSCQRSLVVIELAGDIEDETWRSLYCSVARSLGRGSMIIITSRSEKIAALGTTQALRLKFLPQEAYWYLFKVLAFGSANPDDQPELVSLGMEIAGLHKGSFIPAHIVGSLMRANLNPKFWRRMLQVCRNIISKHLLMFGEHPEDLGAKGHPVYLQTMPKSQNVIVINNVYQMRSAQHSVPKMRTRDLILGRATCHGKFGVVEWSSSIPPYYTYLASCESLTAGCSTVRKKRPRQESWLSRATAYLSSLNRAQPKLWLQLQHNSLTKKKMVHFWRLPKTRVVLVAYSYYQSGSGQHHHDMPKITLNDAHIGSATPRGKFELLAWRSHIPHYYSYSLRTLLSAIMSDLLSRTLSTVIQRYRRSRAEEAEQNLQRLQRVLLRIDAAVEEAEGRHITNQAMLQQLETLRQGMYEGHFMLDTCRYRGHEHGDGNEGIGGHDAVLSRFSSAWRLLSFPIISSTENMQNTVLDAENLKMLEKMVDRLVTLMGDMAEFAVFLDGYPRIGRGPYSEYLVIDKVMFGRQMEKDTVINFLLRSEADGGDGKPGVLPIVGAMRVGKSTLVEHVCLDERVRGYFSSIFFAGDDLGAENMVIKHQNLSASSCQRSLVVIELAGDIEDETWRSLYCSVARSLGRGSMIIITSRSEKIAALGTTQALRLKFLPQEAYWYLFKVLAFGSANPDDQPELVSLGMEIAGLHKGSFIAAHIVGSLMRANLNPKFWRRMLQVCRNFVSKHLLMFGEHPEDLVAKGHPVYIQTMPKSQNVIVITNLYQKRSALHSVPKMRTRDLILGRATRHGKFGVVEWSSCIPPYYTYLASCESLTTGCSIVRKKRPRQELVF